MCVSYEPHTFSLIRSYYPAPRMRNEGSSDCSWRPDTWDLYKHLKLNEYSLLEVHFNTGGLLFKFNGLQYHFVAGQVFVAFANPASVPLTLGKG